MTAKGLTTHNKERFEEWLKNHDDVYTDYQLEDMYDELLNDDPVTIGMLIFDKSEILKELDPTAYRCGLSETMDYNEISINGNIYYCEQYDEDELIELFLEEQEEEE